MHSGAWRVVTSLVTTSTPVPGGHYQIVTGGNALGIELYHKCCLEGSTPQDGLKRTATCKAKRFIPVYRLGEDGDLL